MARIRVAGFDNINGRPVMCWNEFEMGDDGVLRHWVEGSLRAEVPKEGLEDYLSAFPDAELCIPVIASGTGSETVV